MKDYIYLDNAATTFPKPEKVYKTMDEANREFAVNAGRGSYALAQKAENVITKTREQILTLAGADKIAEVVFTPSATFACNQILGGLSLNNEDVVYVSPYEHNAVMRVLYFLQKKHEFEIKELAIDAKTLELDMERIQYQFIKEPPSVVCITHVSNVTGYVLPVKEVLGLVEGMDVVTVVDGSQAFGLVPIELKGSGIDFYIFAGHKTLYGPFGVGGYINNRARELEIVFAGGTGSDSLNLEMAGDFHSRYEPGSPNVAAVAGLSAGVEELMEYENREKNCGQGMLERERELISRLEGGLKKIPGVNLYLPREERRSGICSITVEGYDSSDVGMVLDEDYGIAVRCGYHCAPLIHKYLGDESYGGTVRMSVGRFSTKDEVDEVIKAVEEIVRG